MPKKPLPGSTTWFGWAFLAITVGLLIHFVLYLLFHSVYTALGFGVFATAIAVSTVVTIRKFKRLRELRQGHDICTFARSIPIRELDTWVVRATYEEVSAYMGTEKQPFPVHASDRLKEDLEIDGEDLWDVMFSIAKRCGRNLDDLDKNPLYPRMKTVEDLMRVLMGQQKEEAAEQPAAG